MSGIHHNQPSVDQSDRIVPANLRQTGRTPVEMLISTRVRKSPYWHLSVEAGCWRATVYNRMYHPRGYVRPEHGGAMAEYHALVNDVTLWNAAVERQIQVAGPDAEDFVNYVVTRDITRIEPMRGKYVILCNPKGGILNDPVLLRLSGNEFWFSISDSSLMLWLQGVNVGGRFKVDINEMDVAPLQIQGPKSDALMNDLAGDAPSRLPYYGLMEARIGGCDVVISRTGFSGENGYELYLRDATWYAENLWSAILDAGRRHNLKVIAPAHHRRIAAGILSWGQDMDHETLPFQCNIGYQVPKKKQADYIGRQRLEEVRRLIRQGNPPFKHKLVGMCLGGRPIEDYAPDFWLIAEPGSSRPCGYITSPWYSPELEVNIAMGYVPIPLSGIGTQLDVYLPNEYAESPGRPVVAEVVEMPFRPSVHPSARELARSKRRRAVQG